MVPQVERIGTVPHTELGEGPHWDAENQCLYFVDIFGKTIHKYVPATNKHTRAVIDGVSAVSLIVPLKHQNNKFVISVDRSLAVISWDGESDKVLEKQILCEFDQGTQNRINDGKCDQTGRIWAGTMGDEKENGHVAPNKGSFFSYEKGNVTKHLSNIGISNGIAINTELKKFYYIDSFKFCIEEYDFDVDKGIITNGKPIFTFSKNDVPGIPDGMTIDTDGNLWVACFNGYRVIKIDPRRPETLLDKIPIPAKQVTSVAFGGPNLDELYVTSAKFTVDGEVLSAPEHGSLFRVNGLNATGYPGESAVV